jgi:16S rRNA (guanine(527)-N(7))-methyltransferase RsmG
VFPELLSRCATLNAAQIAALEEHYQLLCRWNKVLNLTRIERLEDAVERHYCEALFLAAHVKCGSVADVGSGAGFPGLVVAVALPDCAVTLIESHQRKAVFLREASRKLPNVRVVAKRAEDVAERFDWVVSRAVSYDDLGKSLGKLADQAALLTGAEEPPAAWPFAWEVLPLPGADRRFLRLGRIVSRETTQKVSRETEPC